MRILSQASGDLVMSLDASIARFRFTTMRMKFGSLWLVNIIGSLRFTIPHWSGYSILLESQQRCLLHQSSMGEW
jgi:hypothetical protein